MSRVVAILDSDTGAFIDADGRVREGARYRKMAKRMLSLDKPTAVLDYGGNDADSLEISCKNADGEEIVLRARSVKISGEALVGGKTIGQMAFSEIEKGISGTPGEIVVSKVKDPSEQGKYLMRISLDGGLKASIESLGNLDGMVRKDDIAMAMSGLSLETGSTLEEVISVLKTLIARLCRISGSLPEEESGDEEQQTEDEDQEDEQ